MFPPVAIARAEREEGEERLARRRSDSRCSRRLKLSDEEHHAARHDTNDAMPTGRAFLCRILGASARAVARAQNIALALVRIDDARGAVSRESEVAFSCDEFDFNSFSASERDRRHTSRRFLGHQSGLTSRSASRVADMPPKKKNVEPPSTEIEEDGDAAKSPAKKKTKTAKVELPEIIPQDPAPRQPIPGGTKTFKAISWNVAGLRALMEKQPEMFRRIVDAEQPDVIALQEHKLQDVHVADLTAKLQALLPEYPTVAFACSSVKKGYSGVAVLCKARLARTSDDIGPTARAVDETSKRRTQPGIAAFFGGAAKTEPPATTTESATSTSLLAVTEGFHGFKDGYDGEGRVLTLEFDAFFLVTAYVPNSGMKLDRLEYRVHRWDEDFRGYLAFLDAKKPVLLGGDLNVARLDADIYNKDAPHIKKSAGTTPEERASFAKTLDDLNFEDTFRRFHRDATGWFTYWSGRVGNRPKNRGLRLDYFLASGRARARSGETGSNESDVASSVEVLDGYILDRLTVGASDHAPLGVTLALR